MAAKKPAPQKGPTVWQRILPWLLRLLVAAVAVLVFLFRQPGEYVTASLLGGILFLASMWAVK